MTSAARDDHRPVTLGVGGEPVAARLYGAPGATAGVVMVGGAGGGFDSPALGLYARLGAALAAEGVTALRVRFRNPSRLAPATEDVLAGVDHLAALGVRRVALIGHSFGGAVVIGAGARSPAVAVVVALSTQTHGAYAAPELAPRALLLVHGTADRVLPAVCSERVMDMAGEPRELVLLDGVGHTLDEAAETVLSLVHDWLRRRLGEAA